jgi:membrane protein
VTALKERIAALRERYGWLDHLLRMLAHYGAVNGSGQAGAVTFFGFLSFFPILALAFFAIGQVARIYPDIRAQMVAEIDNLLPGVVGTGDGQVSLADIESSAATVGLIGLVTLLYSGLGWLSGMRLALEAMFVVPSRERPSFVLGKLRDLLTLVLIGLVLMVSVALSSAVTGFSGEILGWVGIDPRATGPTIALSVLGHVLAILASTLLLVVMFRLLVTESGVPQSALVRGALLGAVGFEVLKLGANLLLGQTQGQPAFQAFGVALILLVWINYFSRLVMYAAAWAYTSPVALARRTAESMRVPGAVQASDPDLPDPAARTPYPEARPRTWLVAAGAAAVGGAAAWIARGGAR